MFNVTGPARFHQDHRRIGWFSLFPPEVVDVNVVRIPNSGIITGWHRHQKQTDYWFCIQGLLQVGVFHTDPYRSDYPAGEPIWTFLSPEDGKVISIPPNTWHGYMSLVPNTILLYGLTNRYDGTDEERFSIEDAGINWYLGAK